MYFQKVITLVVGGIASLRGATKLLILLNVFKLWKRVYPHKLQQTPQQTEVGRDSEPEHR